MRLPVGEQQITTTRTKTTTDDSVYISPDYSTQTKDTEETRPLGNMETEWIESTDTHTETVTLASGKVRYYYYSYESYQRPSVTSLQVRVSDGSSNYSANSNWNSSSNQMVVQIANPSSKTLTYYVTTKINYRSGLRQVGTTSTSLLQTPEGWSSYTLSSYLFSDGDGTVSLSSDGQSVTVSNWAASPGKDAAEIGVWLQVKVHCTDRYITGYSGVASVPYEGSSPANLEVTSYSDAITSYDTPYISGSNIRCWCYGSYSGYGSITFQYTADETVTERYFKVKFNGEEVKGIKFNGTLLDP